MWLQLHRDEVRQASIAFLMVMASAWFYWIILTCLSVFISGSGNYISLFFQLSGIALLPSLYAASQAWYRTPIMLQSFAPNPTFLEPVSNRLLFTIDEDIQEV